ncbi:MAG: hypothetical protein EOP06_16285 [Proteobacteria bacterium]|nr:MAG: hypothetical protein EOP06_16285 [Pseudomonadota bacterium]
MRGLTQTVNSETGSIMVVALVMVGLVSAVALVISGWQEESFKVQNMQKIKRATASIREKVLFQIYNQEAWKATSGANTCLLNGTNCASSAQGILTLRGPDGQLFYDAAVADTGFNFNTVPCDASLNEKFSATGNDLCPFRYELKWNAANCAAGKCQIHIVGEFKYAPLAKKNKVPLSPDKLKLDFIKGFETNSLMSACTSINGLFDQTTLKCLPSNNQVAKCPDGYVFKSVDSTQVPVCERATKGESCPSGQGARGIASNGSLECIGTEQTTQCVYSRTEVAGPCACVGTSCTQPISLIWVYADTNTVCNQSVAAQVCGAP